MKKFVWTIVIISTEQGEYEIIQGFFRQESTELMIKLHMNSLESLD